jgi:Flp pilus assembly pilin Flp
MRRRGERGQSVAEYAILASILTVIFIACAVLLESAVAIYHDHVVSVMCLPLP